MQAGEAQEKHIEPQKLDKVIRESVPAGFETRKKPHRFNIVNNIGDTVEINKVIKPIYNFKVGEE